MFNAKIVSSVSEFPSPLLTVYVNTQLTHPSGGGPAERSVVWREQEAKRVAEKVAPGEQDLFWKEIKRIGAFLREREPANRSLVILAGPIVWQVVPLELEIENELRWGTPALTQLESILGENKAECILVVDRKRARFLRYWLGEIEEVGDQNFEIDVSQWKRKDVGKVTSQDVPTRGSQHDTFDARMHAQYERLCSDVAARVEKLCELENLHTVFLVGSDRLTEPIQAALPKHFPHNVVIIPEDFGGLSLAELKNRLLPKIMESRRDEESSLVVKLLGDARTATVGLDETLAQLQKGNIRSVVVPKDFHGTVHECIECGWTDRSADPVCPVCGRERRPLELRDTVFDLARRTSTDVEVVSGEAASKLIASGGMGGWLRGRTEAQLR